VDFCSEVFGSERSSDPEKNAKAIDKALTEMFQKYPPTLGQ